MTPLLVLLQTAEPEMQTGGWTFMILAWVFVTSLLVWSFRRVLGGGPKDG